MATPPNQQPNQQPINVPVDATAPLPASPEPSILYICQFANLLIYVFGYSFRSLGLVAQRTMGILRTRRRYVFFIKSIFYDEFFILVLTDDEAVYLNAYHNILYNNNNNNNEEEEDIPWEWLPPAFPMENPPHNGG